MPGGGSTGLGGGAGNNGGGGSGGGGGGAGGYGAVVTGAGTTGTLSGAITGGNGGAGGNSTFEAGGSGGSGGQGLVFTDSSATTTLTVNGTVQGGNGGAAATGGGGAGSVGIGGFGIVGGNLSITNNGTISGGLAGDGSTRSTAIVFTGGANTLTFSNATSGLNGGVSIGAGTLTFAQPTDVTVANLVSGAGSIIKTGAGTLTLTGTNTYSGGTTISAGALQIGDGSTAGSITGDIVNNAQLIFNRSDAVSFGGQISGSGGLTKTGGGTLTLTGTNTYTGGTMISAGKLSISSDLNLGAGGGALTLAGGTLLVTQGFATGRVVVLSGSGGTIEVAASQSFLLGSTVSGTGGLTKTGTGTLMLTGANTYTGATSVEAGKLVIGGANTMSAASDYTVASGALLDVTAALGTVTTGSIAGAGQISVGLGSTLETGATNASTTFSGMISDAGSIRKVGAGTLTLTGANSYTGGTMIAGGKLSVSSNGNLGNTAGGLTLNGGTLLVTNSITSARSVTLSGTGGGIEVDAGRAVLLTGTITGSGGLTKSGGGTLALQNNSSYFGATLVQAGTLVGSSSTAFSANSNFTVSAGATLEVSDVPGLVATVGSLAGAGAVQIGNGATLKAGSNNSSTSFSGVISGNGALDKTGTGTLILTGANTYTGGTTVSGGKLVVNGAITGLVSLSGGSLGGSGTIGTLAVASGGTVAPGNSIGTLTVSGNVAFASGSTYQVEVNAAGQSDRIVATGIATIAGGTVQVLAESGNYAASTNYTILTAAGGVTGTFTSVSSNLAFLTPSLSYGGSSVTLTMTRNDTGFGPGGGGSSGGTGGDGTSGGGTSGGTGGGGGTSGTYIAATRNQGFAANAAERLGVDNPVYDTLLSGTAAEARAGFDLLSGEAHAQAVSVMIDESRLVRETILNRLRGPLLTQPGQQVPASFSADLPGRKGAVLMNAPQPRYALWGEAFGGAGNTDSDGNAASLSRRSGGALLGADLMLYDNPGSSLRVGVAGGYSQSRFDLDARFSTGKLESGHAALYASARFGSLRFDAGAAYSWSESDIRRQVAIRGFGDLLRLQRPGSVLQGFAELGYGFAFSGFALEPFAQLALLRVSTDAGTEQGGAAALRVLSSEQTLGFATLGLRAEAQLGSAPLFARAMLGWRHGFGELTPQAGTAFVAGTTPATVFAARIDREALVAEAGLDWRISKATALGLSYSAAIGERSRDHALKGRVEMRF